MSEEKSTALIINKKDAARYAFVVLISLVLMVSVVQAFQIQDLKGDIVSGQLTAKAAPTPSQTQATGAPSAPVRRTSAPTMVGGC